MSAVEVAKNGGVSIFPNTRRRKTGFLPGSAAATGPPARSSLQGRSRLVRRRVIVFLLSTVISGVPALALDSTHFGTAPCDPLPKFSTVACPGWLIPSRLRVFQAVSSRIFRSNASEMWST